ncbi:unnamed protein product [Rotaria sp. Silwood2]|nr:unnamed protein product [Rotaria sp. Silwood2]CAF2727292.1 unnamed protein product [Rotaria sp. Silwood2]CAF3122472.1 unnamed protein product [Rotaria sp. Silwood2]CAF3948560.1 unnamed protein product [Rotaria sp. Silwood2]CAF4004871.1 unnamed protein product [Rotaria sp. Silwood2]
MNYLDDSSLGNFYQFPSWPTTITRSQTSLPNKNTNHMFKLRIDNRNQIETLSKTRLSRHNAMIARELRVFSPPPLHQPTPTPDICSTIDQSSLISSNYLPCHLKPIRVKSATLSVPVNTNSEEILLKNFPKQTHERRKLMQERIRQKQQTLKHAQADSDTWFQLRESLAELKRLATNEDVLVDPTTSIFNCDGFSFEALKQVINQQSQEIKVNKPKHESGKYSSMNTAPSSKIIRTPTMMPTSQNSLSRSRIKRRSTETYPHSTFELLTVATKPLHSPMLTANNHSIKTKTKQLQSSSATSRRIRSASPSIVIPSIIGKHVQLLASDVSNNDDSLVSPIPSPRYQDLKQEEESEKAAGPACPESSNCSEILSSVSLKSKIKLKPQISRCHSAMEIKSSFNKNYPRFILITDQEHQIESWYHQYPFILSDDLLQSFQSKSLNKTTTLAYFIDDYQQFINSNITTKTILQGKPFHINNDWKKYDLIFISNNIYQDIIIYLQTIINLIIKSSGKIIHIYQINHHEDLKTQVRYICKQLNQQIFSHV